MILLQFGLALPLFALCWILKAFALLTHIGVGSSKAFEDWLPETIEELGRKPQNTQPSLHAEYTPAAADD